MKTLKIYGNWVDENCEIALVRIARLPGLLHRSLNRGEHLEAPLASHYSACAVTVAQPATRHLSNQLSLNRGMFSFRDTP